MRNSAAICSILTCAFPIAFVFAGAPIKISGTSPTRIDVGSSTGYTDESGREWLSDRGFSGGRDVNRGDVRVASLSAQKIYRTERVGNTTYRFSVPNGRYTVLFHLVENDEAVRQNGQRVFNIKVGASEYKDVDTWDRAGGRHIPLLIAARIIVKDGIMEIRLSSRKSDPSLAALEVLPDRPSPQAPSSRGDVVIENFSEFAGSDSALRNASTTDERSNWITQSIDSGGNLPGIGMRIDYRMDTLLPYGDNPHFRLQLAKPADLSECRSLQFWAKPDGTDRMAILQLHTADGKTGTVGFTLSGTSPQLMRFPLKGLGSSFWWYPDAQNPSFATKIVAISFSIKHQLPSALGEGTIYFSEIAGSKDEAPEITSPNRPDTRADALRRPIENFETYRSNRDLWANYFPTSHGNALMMTLNQENRGDGKNSMRMDYTFGKKDYAGITITKPYDFSDCNVFRIWVKGDGSGNMLRVFFAAGSGGFFYYMIPLSDTKGQMYEMPFRKFLGYNARTKGILELGFWITRQANSSEGGTVYIDRIEAARNPAISERLAAKPKPFPLPGDEITRISCGSEHTFIDTLGHVWLSDRGFYGGRARSWENWEANWTEDMHRPDSPFSQVFMTERAGSIGYWFGVPNGNYVVKLHFAELWPGATAPGRRVMGLVVNGATQRDIDTVGEPGGRFIPFSRTIPTTVTDGEIEILLQDKTTHNKINGIEIIPAELSKQ